MGIKHIGVMILTYHGYMASSVTWPFDSQGAIFYTHYIVTKSLSPAFFDIIGIEHIGVMAMESNGHVTDDVTWPFKVKVMTPICLVPIISEMAGDGDLATMECLWKMGPWESNGHVTDDVTWLSQRPKYIEVEPLVTTRFGEVRSGTAKGQELMI